MPLLQRVDPTPRSGNLPTSVRNGSEQVASTSLAPCGLRGLIAAEQPANWRLLASVQLFRKRQQAETYILGTRHTNRRRRRAIRLPY